MIRLRRWLFLGLIVATTLFGAGMLLHAMGLDGITPLEVIVIVLFAATFAWISFAFWTAVVGFVLLLLRRDPLSLERTPELGSVGTEGSAGEEPLVGRTALVMPVHNEDPARVTGGIAAILRSLARTGHAEHFDLYLLSDSTDPRIVEEEESAWSTLRRQFDGPVGLQYRRRSRNVGRKAGNVWDFCRRWGGRYELMVVLDADSLMSGPLLVELVRCMRANPDTGLIQTLPLPARQRSLFGRILQFARCLYGPMVATGLSFWQTDTGNYWGHNAIVRVRPFTRHCELPTLPGRPPLGGEILSHDFVEAAFLRRAGWKVYLLPSVGGSFEEVPENILDYAQRDRRWSQGNLQHLRLLSLPGLHAVNRAHFLVGAMGYLSSSLWFLMLLTSTAYSLSPDARGAGGPVVAATGGLTVWPLPGASFVVVMLGVIVAVLFLPKLLAVALALSRDREAFGGGARLVISAILETLFAIVAAPLMMVYHSRFVTDIITGRDTPWDPPMRDARAISWREVWRQTGGATALGAAWGGLTLYSNPWLFLWLTPIFTGLLLAAPIVRWTSGGSAGGWARRRGLFLAPSETSPSTLLRDTSRRVTSHAESESGTGPPCSPAAGEPLLEPRWGVGPEVGRARRLT